MNVLCFGEILWDFLPDGLYPGGAPFNVGYHLHRQGARVRIVSAVGQDRLGEELIRRLRNWGMDTAGIQRPELPTGYVEAEVDDRGNARYRITADVAWDTIEARDEDCRAAAAADVLIFGSLAQRSPTNRKSLQQLLASLPRSAWSVFDVNLRPPFDDLELVRQRCRDSTLLKLNAAEAARLTDGGSELSGADEARARKLSDAANGVPVCITAAERGAGLLYRGTWYWEPGRPVVVADTVGAGDAFLATLVRGLRITENEPAAALARACRVGEWVASRRGATPQYDSFPPP